jgi:hypothetical protein
MVDSVLFRIEVVGFELAVLFASDKWPSFVVDSDDDGATISDAAADVETALLSSW